MAQSGEDLLQRLKDERAALLHTVDGWNAQRLAHQPGTGVWSAVQVFDHLCRVDEGFPVAVRANLPTGHQITLKDRIGCFAVIRVMRSPARVKTPPGAPAVVPAAEVELPDILERWQRADLALSHLLTRVPAAARTTGVFRHPVGGWMALTTGFEFLLAHLQHHGPQLRRLKKTTGAY